MQKQLQLQFHNPLKSKGESRIAPVMAEAGFSALPSLDMLFSLYRSCKPTTVQP